MLRKGRGCVRASRSESILVFGDGRMLIISEARTAVTSVDNAESRSCIIRLRAGPLELFFDQEIGWVRRIMFGDHEIIRSIYGAVRLSDWATVRPVLSHLSVFQHPKNQYFEIQFTAECCAQDSHFVWQGRITGNANAELCYEFDGEARSEFWSNRIGLCVLYPVTKWVGRSCLIEHSDGSLENGTFPKLISPHQPFQDIRAIRHDITSEVALEVRFGGEVFEMEDQRNWTDTSFKVYGTPLARPFPALNKVGQKVKQVAMLKLIKTPKALWPDPPVHPAPSALKIDFSRLRPRPFLGLGFSPGQELAPQAFCALRELNLDHLRVDCRLGRKEWLTNLNEAAKQAHGSRAGLHAAVFVTEQQSAELQHLGETCAQLPVPIRLWLIFHASEPTTPPFLLKMARAILEPYTPGANFAAGTDGNFADLNRTRPPGGADWVPCCSMSPQVHAFDDLSIVENIAAQADVVSTVGSFSQQPLVVSPITLVPRGNTDAPPVDLRQSSLFTAGWTLGSLSVLMNAPHPVRSLTYFETFGSRGLMTSSQLFPVYQILRGASELAQVAQTKFMDDHFALRIAALAGVSQSGRAVLWLVNLTDESISLHVETNISFRSGSLSLITADNGAELSSRHLEIPVPTIHLSRYEIVRLEMET